MEDVDGGVGFEGGGLAVDLDLVGRRLRGRRISLGIMDSVGEIFRQGLMIGRHPLFEAPCEDFVELP